MPSKLKKAIGAVKDRTSISLAKVSSYNTSNLDVAVLKATTHDNVPMEDRHVHEILRLVSSNKVYAAACARAIGKRISRTRNWIVALKSLLLVLRIFQDGDPYFPREVLHAMKRGAKILNLSSFRDDSNSSPWDFTAFVRTFALYLDERLDCFLTGKLQRRFTYYQNRRVSDDCSRSRNGGNEAVRDMKPTMLLDKVANWQKLLERAIATRPTGAAKMNRFVQLSLYAIVQESFELYKDIDDGLSLLFDTFFHLHYQNCLIAYQIFIRARKQYEELTAFYTLCKSLGIGRTSEYPSVRTISLEFIETLQEFLKDQSSFSPAPPPNNIVTSQNQFLLLPAPASASANFGSDAYQTYRGPHPLPATRSTSRQESYGAQSDFSFATTDGYSERASEIASSQCTSLEDLISATEISTLTTPSISIDLEAYPEKFEEHARGGPNHTLNRLSDSGSTQSLPIQSSIDLLALDESTLDSDLETKGNRQPPPAADLHQETEEDKLESSSSSGQGWELVLLAENNVIATTTTKTTTEERIPNVTANIGTPEPDNPTRIFGWEFELEAPTMPPPPSSSSSSSSQSMVGNITTTTTTNYISSLDNLFGSELSIPSSSHHYNPFLQDTIELPTTCSSSCSNPTPINFQSESQVVLPPDSFASVPTFQASFPAPTFRATPTFSSQNSNGSESDPFAIVYNDRQLYSSSSMNQQNLLHEQQLWFANQNKIIAKRMA